MSFESDINTNVKVIVESIKTTILQNLVHLIRQGDLTIDEEKLPGLDKIIRDSTDQAFVNSSTGLNQVLALYTKQLTQKKK